MSYSIGEVSKMFDLPVSTLRYYDAEGLFPDLERKNSVRLFSEKEINTLQLIECLKQTGLEIKEIRHFIKLAEKGPESYQERLAIMEKQLACVKEQMAVLQRAMAMIQFKCWYFNKAIEDGNEQKILAMLPGKLPSDIQKLYDDSHSVR